jgi:predicted transposase/invertase (TIGR01784 family)
MKTDKLFYRIFLNQPGLISELVSGIPPDCEFEYSAPVIKENETRLDGLLTPVNKKKDFPLIFLEAQMQRDQKFYGRYFRGIFSYLEQYETKRSWQGLLIILNNRLDLGSEIPYQNLLNNQVERLYLEDLLDKENLSPNLAILRLIIIPKAQAGVEARQILNKATTETEYKLKLDLVEAILVNKFNELSIEEIQKMLNLREADVTQTRFYQEVLERGEKSGEERGVQKGLQEGEANLVMRQLNRRCGNISEDLENQVRSLSIRQLESLGEALLDFKGISDLENWFNQ